MSKPQLLVALLLFAVSIVVVIAQESDHDSFEPTPLNEELGSEELSYGYTPTKSSGGIIKKPTLGPDDESEENLIRGKYPNVGDNSLLGGFIPTTPVVDTGTMRELIKIPTEGPVEQPEDNSNGGDPYVSPGEHKHGTKHVRAHDGYHNIKREKLWAHWNDAFTTAGSQPDIFANKETL
ncbi:hypothetical protein KR093_001070 [Drosophila rubida]|uniref:Secreted protein n=1 Tax=Drosophila rubida TaxID=30044 RepID=A0AAD4K476_9MUSC|nr:hypothetical protein KR093_001070 [Drosophila rubida]